MRRLARGGDGALSGAARGVAFLWALLIGFPLMFFGLGMAVDFTRVIIAEREMATATHAAALAAAYQFNPGRATINAPNARAAAIETMCVAREQGAIRLSDPGMAHTAGCTFGGGSVSARVTLPSPTTVTVTTTYRLKNMILLSYFDVGSSDQSVTRSASVCDPRNASGATGGFCTRPAD